MGNEKLMRINGKLYNMQGFSDEAVESLVRSGADLRSREVRAPAIRKGCHTEAIRGTVNYVTNHSNDFFERMGTLYPTFEVVSASTVSLPDSVCMYIVYKV